MTTRPGEITQLLEEWSAGDKEARDRLMTAVYDDLRRMAGGYFKNERVDHTLQPTALVHEAMLRFFEHRREAIQGREHLLALMALTMRRVLVDHARRRAANKHGGAITRVTLNEAIDGRAAADPAVLDLDRALARLEVLDARMAKIVELRVFGGVEVDEIAALIGISAATVKRDWHLAKAWLRYELSR